MEQLCGVTIVGKGVDSFWTVKDEEDVEVILALIRKAAGLPQRAGDGERS